MTRQEPGERFIAATRTALMEMVEGEPRAASARPTARSRWLVQGAAAAVVLAIVVTGTVLALALPHPIASTTGGSPVPTASATPETQVSAVLAKVAQFRRFAEQESLGGPFTISYVVSTSKAAERLLYGDSGSFEDSRPAIAMVADGRFSANWEKVPSGASPKPGRYLTQVIPLSGVGTQSEGLGNTVPDLAKLGPVTVAPLTCPGSANGIEPFGCSTYVSTDGHDAAGDIPWLRTTTMTVRFSEHDGRPDVGVEAGCNGFGAAATVTTAQLRVDARDTAVTGAACSDDHVEDAVEFFARPVTYTLSRGLLTLDNGSTVIRLRARATP